MTKEPVQKPEVQKPPEKSKGLSVQEKFSGARSKLEERAIAIKNSVLGIAQKHSEVAEELRDIELHKGQLAQKGQEAAAALGTDSRNEIARDSGNSKEKISEDEIKRLEKEKGIETDEDRVIEASLLIDKKFLDVQVIAGKETSLERIFGGKAWADWLNARIAAKNYGNNELNLDFIIDLHSRLAKHTNPQIAGEIRQLQVTCGDYKNLGRPVVYTDNQIDAIKANPDLSFRQMGTNPNEGIITFPNRTQSDQQVGGLTTESVVRALLTDVCTWYNGEKQKPDYDPYILAANLQRKIVSIHPFNDINGRLSRLLMNWSLENDGSLSSILDDPNDDILVSPKEWAEKVKEGSERHVAIEARKQEMQKANVKDIAELMGLDDERTFYKYVYRHVKKAPNMPKRGKLIDHVKHDDFNRSLKSEMANFNQEFTANSRLAYTSDKYIDQGGLASQLYIDVVKQGSVEGSITNLETYKQHRFFSDIEVFRGVGCNAPIGDTGILNMFGHFVGLDAGYRASTISGIPINSNREVPAGFVAQSLEEYNQMLGDAYLAKHGSRWNNVFRGRQIARGKSLSYSLGSHTYKPTEKSPFVSTTSYEPVANKFVAYESNYGVLFKAFSPKKTGILGYGTKQREDRSDIPFFSKSKLLVEGMILGGIQRGELEIMIPGGLDPASVYSVEAYEERGKDKYGTGGKRIKTMDANRVIKDGNEYVIINDYKADPKNPEKRVYALKANGAYEKVEDLQDFPIV